MYNLEYMIDIETMHVNKTPVIVQIGMMPFDSITGEQYGEYSLLLDVCPYSCKEAGGEYGEGTQKWWEDRGGFHNVGEPVPICNAIKELKLLMFPDFPVWAKGSTFDIAVIEGYCDRMGVEWPWKYNMPQDTRTIARQAKYLGWKKPKTGEIPHQALEDCKVQIVELMSALNFIREGFKK